jgi:hypothetical protein
LIPQKFADYMTKRDLAVGIWDLAPAGAIARTIPREE